MSSSQANNAASAPSHNQLDTKAQAWSALFSEPMSDLVKRYTASVDFDQRLWRQDINGSLAHARMLAKQGIIAAADLADIEKGMAQIVEEIVYNLCDNAIEYNVEGGSVTMSVGERDGKVFVSVADTGIGIAPEHQSRIFERFYRVDKSHSKASGGTGLGLSIVKHAVQYHHGTVELHSEEGKGTTICILLPKE
jgi:signal transduction histidine kinase